MCIRDRFIIAFWLMFRGFSSTGYSIDLKRYGTRDWGWYMAFGILAVSYTHLGAEVINSQLIAPLPLYIINPRIAKSISTIQRPVSYTHLSRTASFKAVRKVV